MALIKKVSVPLLLISLLVLALGQINSSSAAPAASRHDLAPVLIRDINTDTANSKIPHSSPPDPFVDVNGTSFFAADDGLHGRELWKSDGTPEGTMMVKDINPDITPGFSGSNTRRLTPVGGTLFFLAHDGVSGLELWKSDGTPEGTMMVKDISPGFGLSSNGNYLTDFGGTLFFQANDGINGAELWKSDGTPEGTMMVKDISPGPNSSSPAFFTEAGGSLFFSANDGTDGRELWKTDGTAEGTVLVKDINPSGNSSPFRFTDVAGILFFQTSNSLWKSDGTPEDTLLVKGIRPNRLVNFGGTLYFGADELWKSDGTPDGTVIVKQIAPIGNSSPNFLTVAGGQLFFLADDGTNGRELWKSDGTSDGTVLVKDIRPDGNGVIYELANVGGTLYFPADDGTNGRELWKSDGTPEGTVIVKDISPVSFGSQPELLVDVEEPCSSLLMMALTGLKCGRATGLRTARLWSRTSTATP